MLYFWIDLSSSFCFEKSEQYAFHMVHEYSKGISHIKPQAMQIYNWLLNDYFSVYSDDI